MKKSTLFLAIALLVTIGFSSCENENNSLRDTTWLSEKMFLDTDTPGDKFQFKIKFYTKTDCETIGVIQIFLTK